MNDFDIMNHTLRALERHYPEPRMVEAPPLVAHMKPQEQDGYLAEFHEQHPDQYRIVVFGAICPGHAHAVALCQAVTDKDDAEAGRLLREMVRSDLVDAIDRRRNAR